jgi:hypothetical protein
MYGSEEVVQRDSPSIRFLCASVGSHWVNFHRGPMTLLNFGNRSPDRRMASLKSRAESRSS